MPTLKRERPRIWIQVLALGLVALGIIFMMFVVRQDPVNALVIPSSEVEKGDDPAGRRIPESQKGDQQQDPGGEVRIMDPETEDVIDSSIEENAQFDVVEPPAIDPGLKILGEGAAAGRQDEGVSSLEYYSEFADFVFPNGLDNLNCVVPASMSGTVTYTFPEVASVRRRNREETGGSVRPIATAGEVLRFSMVVKDQIHQDYACDSFFLVRYNGTAEPHESYVSGVGRVDCHANSGNGSSAGAEYKVSVVFPLPGVYVVEIARFIGHCDTGVAVLPSPDDNKASFQLQVRQTVARITSERCRGVDLEIAELGYLHQLGQASCELPHCEGTLRKSHWNMPGGLPWSPFHCHLRYYTAGEVLMRLRGKTLMFLGDSTMDEMVEGFLMATGAPEMSVMASSKVVWNYTDSTGRIRIRNLMTHRLLEADYDDYDLHLLHRFTGDPDIYGNGLGTRTFGSDAFLAYFDAHFGPNAAHRPDLVIFNSGRHDPWKQESEMISKMEWLAGHMAELAKKVNTRLLWRTNNVGTFEVWTAINSMATKVMRDRGIPVVDVSGPGWLRDKEDVPSFTDGIHFGLSAISHGALYLDVHEAMTQILIQGIFDVLQV